MKTFDINMDSYKISGMKMDFENLILCIKCHDDSTNVNVILETLKTIADMCRSEACGRDALREVGGLDFLWEFLSTTDKTIFLEYSLKVIAFAVDGNVQNQMFMTKSSIFQVLLSILLKRKLPISVLNNTVILISTILFNNSKAQILLFETGLIQELINMYKCYDPILKMEDRTSLTPNESRAEIWLSINTALCFAVNNPLNEKNQQICSSLFPVSLKLLESSDEVDINISASTFLSLSIANNERNQDAFAKYDGSFVIKHCLKKMFDSLHLDLNKCNVFSERSLVVISSIIELISATSMEHENNAALYGKLGVIHLLIKLLSMDIENIHLKIKICLALGHCIEACRDNRTYILDEEGFDKLLEKNLSISNEELHFATKCLLQVCVSNKHENCEVDGQSPNLNISKSNERMLSCWLKLLDKRHNQDERKSIGHKVLDSMKRDNHKLFTLDCKSKVGSSSHEKSSNCCSSNARCACNINKMDSFHHHKHVKCKCCTCVSCDAAAASSSSSKNCAINLVDFKENLNSFSKKRSSNSSENIIQDINLTDESSLESAGDLYRRVKNKNCYLGTTNGNSKKPKVSSVAERSNLSCDNIFHLDYQKKCAITNDHESSSSFSNACPKLRQIHHNHLSKTKSNIFVKSNCKSLSCHSEFCKSSSSHCNNVTPFITTPCFANLKLNEKKVNQTSTPILDNRGKEYISHNDMNFSSIEGSFSNFNHELPYREPRSAGVAIPENEIILGTNLKQAIDGKLKEGSNMVHFRNFRETESLQSPRFKKLTEVLDNDFKLALNDRKEVCKKSSSFQHTFNSNLNCDKTCDSTSVKARRNEQKGQKISSGESDAGKSINSNGCMEVLVFPGTSCVAHKLASNSEMLRVAPLDDIISNDAKRQ